MQQLPRILGASPTYAISHPLGPAAHAICFHGSARLVFPGIVLPLHMLCPTQLPRPHSVPASALAFPWLLARGLPHAILLPQPSGFAPKDSEMNRPNYERRRSQEGHPENLGPTGLSQVQILCSFLVLGQRAGCPKPTSPRTTQGAVEMLFLLGPLCVGKGLEHI